MKKLITAIFAFTLMCSMSAFAKDSTKKAEKAPAPKTMKLSAVPVARAGAPPQPGTEPLASCQPASARLHLACLVRCMIGCSRPGPGRGSARWPAVELGPASKPVRKTRS